MTEAGFRHFKPPQQPPAATGRIRVFLGGSIEMGKAEDWQRKLADLLAQGPYATYIDVYNPRRDDWDPSWPNEYDFPPFRAQVDWELNNQKDADLIVYYFAADTLSPITLLELGLFRDRAPVVGFDPAYRRTGNLMVTKDHFAMDLHTGWESFAAAVEQRLEETARGKNLLPAAASPAGPSIQPAP